MDKIRIAPINCQIAYQNVMNKRLKIAKLLSLKNQKLWFEK